MRGKGVDDTFRGGRTRCRRVEGSGGEAVDIRVRPTPVKLDDVVEDSVDVVMVEKEVLRSRRMTVEYRKRKPSIGERTARHAGMNHSLQSSGVRVGDRVSSRTEGQRDVPDEGSVRLRAECAGDPTLLGERTSHERMGMGGLD